MRAVLPPCRAKGIRIITNMGAANPLAAAAKVRAIARSLNQPELKVAAVVGDDVLGTLRAGDYIDDSGNRVNAIGAVITGRVADPALVLAPLIHQFGSAMDDWKRLGQGTLVGHLLECAGQITGGYFADPGFKDVAGLARLGFPIGEVAQDGSLIVTKVAGSGGQVTAATCKEQLLYEIDDPRAYVTPDVVADFSGVQIAEIGPDRVRVSGATGRACPPTRKVSVGYIDSYIGEGQMSYAGPGALDRARLALSIVEERFNITGRA